MSSCAIAMPLLTGLVRRKDLVMQRRSFIATTGKGIVRATEAANDEWQVEKLLSGSDVRCLAVDPLNKERVYAGTQGTGVLRSDDRGRTWASSGLDGGGQSDSSKSYSPGAGVRGHQACLYVRFTRWRRHLDRANRFQAHPVEVALVLACREAVHRLRASYWPLAHQYRARSGWHRIRRNGPEPRRR